MPTPKTRHTVTAQCSPDLYRKVQELHANFPGASLHKVMLACIAMATESDPEIIKTYLQKGKHEIEGGCAMTPPYRYLLVFPAWIFDPNGASDVRLIRAVQDGRLKESKEEIARVSKFVAPLSKTTRWVEFPAALPGTPDRNTLTHWVVLGSGIIEQFLADGGTLDSLSGMDEASVITRFQRIVRGE